MGDDVGGAGKRGNLDEEAVEVVGAGRAVRGGMHAGVETELICDVTTAAAMWGRSCEETMGGAGRKASWLYVDCEGEGVLGRAGQEYCTDPLKHNFHSFVLIAFKIKLGVFGRPLISPPNTSRIYVISLGLSHSMPSVSLHHAPIYRGLLAPL